MKNNSRDSKKSIKKNSKAIRRNNLSAASSLSTQLPERLKKNLKLIIIFAIIGIILSLYLTYQHYKEGKDAFCQALR